MSTVALDTSASGAPDDRATGRTGASLLESIQAPCDLRRLDHAQLATLAAEIRTFLVESLALTGGHLGSNLGAVELTLALHRVFDSPRDSIVWDTGHQAYVHKVVTGRANRFDSLRQAGGLSGYPSRAESEHDLVENSHASTALSYSHGIALARRLRDEPRTHHVVAVVGDGALTGGLAFEALNNIGHSGARVIVVVNDNGRSYAPTQSRLSAARHGTIPDAFFSSLGLDYLGLVDGHDVEATESLLHAARAHQGPCVVHVVTQKGRGYRPAELDEEKCLHDIGPYDPATGRRRPSRGRSYTDAFSEALVEEASRRSELVAITAAMPGSTGLLAFEQRFPDRFFDVGIAEQHAVTMAAGLAMAGMRPVVAIYAAFLNRAWDQLYYDVGLHRLPVVFCVDRAGITGDDGPSHHGVLDLALLTKVPGMTVLAPSNADDVAPMLRHALEQPGPVAIRWPKTPSPAPSPSISILTSSSSTTGMARRLRHGHDVCLLGFGKLVAACEQAAELLSAHGLSASVWDVRAVPLDPVMLDDAMRHRAVVTAEDACTEGGVGALITAALHRRAHDDRRVLPRVQVCGVPVRYVVHGNADRILAELGLDAGGLASAATSLLCDH